MDGLYSWEGSGGWMEYGEGEGEEEEEEGGGGGTGG